MIAMTQKVLSLFYFLQRFLPLQAFKKSIQFQVYFLLVKELEYCFFLSTAEVAPGLSEVNDDDDDDDAAWYRREVGKEPDPGKYQHNNKNKNLLFQV